MQVDTSFETGQVKTAHLVHILACDIAIIAGLLVQPKEQSRSGRRRLAPRPECLYGL